MDDYCEYAAKKGVEEDIIKDVKTACYKELDALLYTDEKVIIEKLQILFDLSLIHISFIDHKRNEKAKETADFVKKVGTKNAVMNSDEVALSNKGRAYYDSNTGAKYGGWLGAAAGVIGAVRSFVNQKVLDSQIQKQPVSYTHLKH